MSSPGRAFRKGISLIELFDMFPDEQSAVQWFESITWSNGRCCGHCGSTNTKPTPHGKPQPYWCPDCRSYFSVRTGTALESSKVPLRKWALAIYLCLTSLKGVSSMKLHRDLGVRQATAWFMLHRIREAWATETFGMFDGPVEADEAFFGGKAKNMHRNKRHDIGKGGTGKMEVVGIKDRNTRQVRAAVIRRRGYEMIDRTPREFVLDHTMPNALVYTDETVEYKKLPNREFVTHGTGEYVRGMAHINGMESFWSMLKRAYAGTFHKLSPKHLARYIAEFQEKYNIRDAGTLEQMRDTVARLVGCRLMYRNLIADNGLPSGARPLRPKTAGSDQS